MRPSTHRLRPLSRSFSRSRSRSRSYKGGDGERFRQPRSVRTENIQPAATARGGKRRERVGDLQLGLEVALESAVLAASL